MIKQIFFTNKMHKYKTNIYPKLRTKKYIKKNFPNLDIIIFPLEMASQGNQVTWGNTQKNIYT